MKKSRIGLIAMLLIMALVITGCSLTEGKWAAKVNGEEISVSKLNKFTENAQKLYEQMGLDFSGDSGKAMLEQLKASILERLIETTLIKQEVANLGLTADDPKVIAEKEKIMDQFNGDDEQFKKTLQLQGMDEEALTNFLILYVYLTDDVTLSDEEVLAYFEENKANYGEPEKVKASHILVETEEEALEIIKELDNGADFAGLAKEKSIEDGADETGGSLGYFTRDEMVEEFSNAAFAQEVGTYSKTPVKTAYGYHIILVEDHTEAVEPKFEDVKEDVMEDALIDAKDKKYSEYMENLYKKATIEYASKYKPKSNEN